jgi:ribosomal protein S18 acetylase RimI-like enzyme
MIPLSIQLGNISTANLEQLKVINNDTLPVKYTDKFYKDLLINYPQELLQYAFFNGFTVGAVCARIEPHDIENCNKLYIMTINVLSAYRRRGVASALLHHVLNEASKNDSIIEVYLHVQTSNSEAKSFYLSHGFEEIEIIKGYYRNIDPPDSYLLKKSLRDGHVVSAGKNDADAQDMQP